jgi:NADPH:quinone reductase-like Zn-dependent oxidoreductase
MKQWILPAGTGIDRLKVKEVSIPDVGENEVLVKFHAVSLNYRDIMIAQVRTPLISRARLTH